MDKKRIEKIVKEIENFSTEELAYFDELMIESNRKLLKELEDKIKCSFFLDF